MKISLRGRIDIMQNTESNMYVMICKTRKTTLTRFKVKGSFPMDSSFRILNTDVTVWVKIRNKIKYRARRLLFILYCIVGVGYILLLIWASLVLNGFTEITCIPTDWNYILILRKVNMQNSVSIMSVTKNMDEPKALSSGLEWNDCRS